MNMLKVGDKAPEFSVLDEQSNLRTSESLKGSRYIVFFTLGLIHLVARLRLVA